MKKPKIIVTGGAGFIGSNLVETLNQKGEDRIIIVDHLNEGNKWKNLLGLKFLDYIEKDEFLEKIEKGYFKDVSAIVHLGACSNTTVKDLHYLYLNNYKYSQKLALFALENEINFIYASSAATYGDGSMGFSDEEALLPKLKPLNPYGFSKHLFDLWLYYNKLLNQVVGLKYFNVFGEREFHKGEMKSVALKAYEEIKKEGKVKLFKSYHPDYKDGEQLRDFIYVKDAVEVTIFFLENPKIKGIFNVGTGKARSFKDLVLAIFSALSLPPNIEYIEMPEYLKNQYQYFTQADITKLRKVGYNKPMWELESAIKNYVNYLEKNYNSFYG
ncbi:ADP-L-glycero-D-manno-heptose-6-epimerase [Thermodesulfobacterium geofontis OPF15]|uniref:ADP-L-glycero-D-manno-heptose-6-epimerase n=1 Tax=Thermodesulfobacterium geofontis (strain OPF15) TaxID=795359 RepID=F8C347_THEGP|nr:ADP-glyceromanno-heptose 6-epimerase [Thermodesulfobacterium geofontis]AEH23539.1 ADP-L-glycero-D-manno-heptose-6-epimerase [Thermodesulfobacterium geofontis OPF15]